MVFSFLFSLRNFLTAVLHPFCQSIHGYNLVLKLQMNTHFLSFFLHCIILMNSLIKYRNLEFDQFRRVGNFPALIFKLFFVIYFITYFSNTYILRTSLRLLNVRIIHTLLYSSHFLILICLIPHA